MGLDGCCDLRIGSYDAIDWHLIAIRHVISVGFARRRMPTLGLNTVSHSVRSVLLSILT